MTSQTESPSPGDGPAPTPLVIEIDHRERVNYALQTNNVPLVRRLRLHNPGPDPFPAATVRLSVEPDFAPPVEIPLDALPAGGEWTAATVDLPLRTERLINLTERAGGRIDLALLVDGEVRQGTGVPVEILAYNEWDGSLEFPEGLAAFSLPNHPGIDPILTRAARRLEERTGRSGLEGYGVEDAEAVRAQVRAVWAALAELGVSYIRPPASFEARGQKIRTPDMIAESPIGTCLDLALLLAACLEQAGLHPLVVLLREHALCACWTRDHAEAEALLTDGAALRNRADLGELILVETTGLTLRPPQSFQEALQAGRGALDGDGDLVGAVDIRAARDRGILPLPLRVSTAVFEPPPAGDFADPDPVEEARAGDLPFAPTPEEPPAPGPEDRLSRWKKRLLDLTLRNRLLNFRETVRTIRLHCPDPAALEDDLSGGAAFTLHPHPRLMEENDPRDPELHAARTGEDVLAAYLREAIRRRRLHTRHDEEDLGKRLTNLYRAARSSLEESGANTLYLAVGFLHWYEEEGSAKERRAPLLLLPLELHRLSAREGYRVRLADEDPQLNITLIRKLETDYRIRALPAEELPADESGLDVKAILDAFRRAIKGMARWEVREEACIGLFSFTKFLMWRDLDGRLERLHRNRVVEHLLEDPDGPLEEAAPFPDPRTLDATRPPTATFTPLDADASQLAAVFAAEEGRDFVLQGPPGTGKSQTITNMIAHGLTRGLRVLFVAEKRAALEVVHRRLSRVGLAPFCLELHSNKAQKKEVIAALGASLELHRENAPRRWEEQGRRLGEARADLGALVAALHTPGPSGLSFRQLVGRLVQLGEGTRVDLPAAFWRNLDQETLDRMRGAVEELAGCATPLGDPTDHPWRAVQTPVWSRALAREVPDLAGELEEALRRLTAALEEAGLVLGVAVDAPSAEDLDRLEQLTRTLLTTPRPAAATLEARDWPALRERAAGWLRVGRSRAGLRSKLFGVYTEELLELDLGVLRDRLAAADGAIWPLGWWRRRGVRRSLDRVRRPGAAEGPPASAEVLGDALALRKVEEELDRFTPEAAATLGSAWQGGETDWETLEALLDWCDRFLGLLSQVAEPAGLVGLAAAGPTPEQVAVLTAWLEAREQVERIRSLLAGKLALDPHRAWGGRGEADLPGRLLALALAWQGHPGELREWCLYRERAARVEALGLGPLLAAFEGGACPAAELVPVLDRSLLEPHAEHLMEAREELRRFHGAEQDRRIEAFRELDREVLELTREAIRARLGERLPARTQNAGTASSEVGILQREVHKRSRHLPLRRLFTRIPNLLPLLKPCLLMSPLSVAQYLDGELDRDEPLFDLVIFDEASQIPPWDAVGAIARGRQVVVVGDSRQLPPTNFFQRVEEEEPVDEETVEDLESILEECAAAGVPVAALEWHYRSRHESLIAFSNHRYYEDRLSTFPSPCRRSPRLGVSLRHLPEAVYDKAATRTNPVEAEAVVAEIVRRLRDPAERNRSIGVVTFNLAQQTRIENLLDAARREHPEIEAGFDEEGAEPVFVKNLENVQGDERDVILFSVGYGPDARGRLSMNFGPLNQKGGERRLNVAVTRAREQVVVFCSFRAEQIDLSRTDATGARHLREFLDYAARGTEALGLDAGEAAPRVFPSPFEAEVHRVLVEAGHTVHSRVGCSSYRVDLAVVDPREKGRYLLGIECDGESWRRGRTARERDRLRQEVLAGLGWRLVRIWSIDWWIDREREAASLLQRVEEALARPLTSIPASARPPEAEGEEDRLEPNEAEEAPDGKEPAGAGGPDTIPYVLATDNRSDSAEAFFQGRKNRTLRAQIGRILEVEAPIHVELAARRLASFYGIDRLTGRVGERFESLLAGLDAEQAPRRLGDFLWRPDQDPDTWPTWRGGAEEDPRPREPHQIPPREVAGAAAAVLREEISLPRGELLKATARLFGFTRLGSRVEESMAAGLAILLAAGVGEEKEDTIVLRQS